MPKNMIKCKKIIVSGMTSPNYYLSNIIERLKKTFLYILTHKIKLVKFTERRRDGRMDKITPKNTRMGMVQR